MINRKNKKLRIIIIIVIASLLFCIYVLNHAFSKKVAGEKALGMLKVDDISNISVLLQPPGETVQIENLDEVVNALNDVVIYEKDNSYKECVGQSVIFTITFKDGDEMEVMAYNPFIVIDGVGYRTEYGPCEKLNQIANKLIE